MQKKAFTIIEVVIVFLLMLGITFFLLPRNLESTKQAKLISKWGEKYNELEYMFSVIRAQKDSEIKQNFQSSKNNEKKEKALLETIKPCLRISSEVKEPYKQVYMNKMEVPPMGRYYFEKFYYTNQGEVVGLKLINPDCKETQTCAIMAFDENGVAPPNTWGFDVFGINVTKDGIEPFGKNIDTELLRSNCSKDGSGVFCSYYYLMGGHFD